MKIFGPGIFLLLITLFSCSTTDEAVITEEEPIPTTTSSELLLTLVDSDWDLTGCPENASLIINGYSACQYLDRVSFTEAIVYIKNVVNSYLTPHNICAAYDENLRLSTHNNCTTARFVWRVISITDDVMVIEVRAPGIDSDYHELFEYTRAG